MSGAERLAVVTTDAHHVVERNMILAPRSRDIGRERVPQLRHQAAVLDPQDLQQRNRQTETEPTLGLLNDRVCQRRLNPI